MRFYVPVLGAHDARVVERLGGLPFGLPAARWPICSDCGGSQSFIAQFAHDAARLDLGGEGRVLLVFQCERDPGMCETWSTTSGANACLVLEAVELGALETPAPADGPPILPVATICRWLTRDDGLTSEEAESFFDQASLLALGDEIADKATYETRLGSVPQWLQSPDEAPKPNWRFVAQLESQLRFVVPPDPLPEGVSSSESWQLGESFSADGPSFGSGLAYVFLRDHHSEAVPDASMFWQCD